MSTATALRSGTEATTTTPYWELDLRGRLNHSLFVADLNRKEMAEALGLHRNTVASYLRADNPVEPDRRTLVAWAVRCGVSISWLERGAEPVPDGGSDLPSQSIPCISDISVERARRRADRGVPAPARSVA